MSDPNLKLNLELKRVTRNQKENDPALVEIVVNTQNLFPRTRKSLNINQENSEKPDLSIIQRLRNNISQIFASNLTNTQDQTSGFI